MIRKGLWTHIARMTNHTSARHPAFHALLVVAALLGAAEAAPLCIAEELKAATVESFDRYVRTKEAKNDEDLAGRAVFLWIDSLPEPARGKASAELRRGQIITRHDQCAPAPCASIPGGLIHDWVGIVFVPGVSMPQAIAALEDYDQDAGYYQPQVMRSKLLERSGDDFRVFLRLKRAQILTVVLDTEYDIHYTHWDATHASARSYSTRIAEVEHAGEPQEREKPVGDDRGLLWRLYSYWRFYQADGGVYIQCEAISLTRDVPAGLGWLVRPFIDKIPADSLRFTLEATRKAIETSYRAGPVQETRNKRR